MPRQKKAATTPPAPAPNAFVASAARIVGRRKDRPLGNGPEPWQEEAWYFFDTCGELAFVTQWQANAMSQVKLRLVEELPNGDKVEVPEDAAGLGSFAVAAMDALYDGDAGQDQMMAAFGTHLSVPGDCYLLGIPPDDTLGDEGRDLWRVVSNEELKETPADSGRWELDRGDGLIERFDTRNNSEPAAGVTPALVIRVWRSHPRKHVLATSPVRAALPVLRELEGLNKRVASTIDSRLAGAGILLVPSEMTFQTPLTDGQPPTDGEIDDFLAALTQAMQTALSDPGSAAARVPIVVKAPGQFLDAIKHITFDVDLDDRITELRETAIRRIALSLDVPPEVLLGTADVNHWGGWLISEDAIKLHVEPLAGLVAEAIQTRYLWPAMQGNQMILDPAIKRFTLEPDTSALRQRTLDHGQTMAMHDRYLISDETLIRESRFDVGDMPSDEERRRRFTEAIALGGASPDVVAAAIMAITDGKIRPIPVQTDEPTALDTAPPAPTPLPVAPVDDRQPPEPAPPVAASAGVTVEKALALASVPLVLRAVEKAWNRAGKRGSTRRAVEDPAKLDACLTGAWAQVPAIAGTLGVDPARLTAALDLYARGLLTSGAEHDEALFARLLDQQVLAPEAGAA